MAWVVPPWSVRRLTDSANPRRELYRGTRAIQPMPLQMTTQHPHRPRRGVRCSRWSGCHPLPVKCGYLDSMSEMTYVDSNGTNRQAVGLAARRGQDSPSFLCSPS